MSQLRVYETSRPAAAATAAAFSPITQTHLFLPPRPPCVRFIPPAPSANPHSLSLTLSPCAAVYTFLSTRAHRQSVYRSSRPAPPRVQTIRNIKLISPRVYIVLII